MLTPQVSHMACLYFCKKKHTQPISKLSINCTGKSTSIHTAKILNMPWQEAGLSQTIGASANPKPPPETKRIATTARVNNPSKTKLIHLMLLCAIPSPLASMNK